MTTRPVLQQTLCYLTLRIALMTAAGALVPIPALAQQPPNILLIIAEDIPT